MSKTKRYFWLKFKDDFFNKKEIKKLRTIAGGDTFTIIYLKMQLLSIKKEGLIVFEGTEECLAEQLALQIDEDIDNIKIILQFLYANNLLEKLSDESFLLTKVPELIGSETDSAERMRRLRANSSSQTQKASLCSPDVRKSDTEIEKEIEKELELETYKEKSLPYAEIIAYLNKLAGTRYRVTENTKKHISGRFSEGYTKKDFFTVIENKTTEWKGSEWEKYLRPSTLFLPSKFEGYLFQKPFVKKGKKVGNEDYPLDMGGYETI